MNGARRARASGSRSRRELGALALGCMLGLGCQRQLPSGEGSAGEAAGTGAQGTTEDEGPGVTSTSTNASADSSTGAPFDIEPWVGRHHYEGFLSQFGEATTTNGGTTLANFEIRPDSTALSTYDDCFIETPIPIEYVIEPLSQTRVRLQPAPGDATLRYSAGLELDEIQLTLDERCGVITLELTGGAWVPGPVVDNLWHPGAACWVDRCTSTTPAGETTYQIDYCEGEEPPPCP